jgi:hypothetical protein
MIRILANALLWVLGLVGVATVGFILWYGGLAATNVVLPGEVQEAHLVPAAIVGLAPIAWYVWLTLIEPLRLRQGSRAKRTGKL